MNMNPMQLLAMMRNGQNPTAMLMQLMQSQMGGTPLGDNLVQMAKNNDTQGIENVARNLCQQRGLDFDKEFASFKQQLGL